MVCLSLSSTNFTWFSLEYWYLNKNLLKGSDLLYLLSYLFVIFIYIRFRIGHYAVMGDIEQMLYQILIENKDRDVLRFLWSDNI